MEFTNKCRGCGKRFIVSQNAIDEMKASYPDEPTSDAEAANIVEFCEVAKEN